MKHRELGSTGLNVSEIAVGCSGYWGHRRFSEHAAAAVIQEAIARGVNFFDTGHNYSNYHAEPRLGRVLKPLLNRVDRSTLVISSKAGTTIPTASLLRNPRKSATDYSPDYIERACRQSIKNLNCGYLDIFQLHGISQASITPALIERLMEMKGRGLFRFLGVNTHSLSDMLFIAQHPDVFDMVLIDYSVLQLDREPAIERLSDAGIGVVAGTVLAQGHLIKGKIGKLRSAADVWYLARALGKPAARRLARRAKRLHKVLDSQPGLSAAQVAFAFALANPNVASCVFGTTRVENLAEVIDAAQIQLRDDFLEQLRNHNR